MIIRAKAPLRVSFAGGGTDLPSYYLKHRGAVLVSTINYYSFVTLYPKDQGEVTIRSLDFDQPTKYHVEEQPIYDSTLEIARAAVRRMCVNQGFDLQVHSDAPPGSGLGGSSSITTAIIGSLMELSSNPLDNYKISELAYSIERNDLKISGGRQDQYAIAFGGFNLIEYYNDRIIVNPLRIEKRILNDLECHLMLCYTGKTRLSAGLIDKQVQYYEEGRDATLEGLAELYDLAYTMKEALLKGQLETFGMLLDVSMESKKKMNPHVTDDKIDELYQVAKKHGVIGGKILGAGGGGYLVLFCETDKKPGVRASLEAMGGQFIDLTFVRHGLQSWRSTCL